jgi:hypothetical protein
MIAMKNLATVAIVFSAAATGCASQSAAFNAMSATDHERAARATQGDESLAREHLDAANRLRNEEVAACDGVPDSDRSNGPFARYGSVTDVEVVRDHGVFPKGPLEPVGVSVYMRAEPAMTAQWLGRVIACHSAHLAVVGAGDRPSPLAIQDAQVAVSTTFDGFRVTVTSKNPDIARAVVDKGRELAAATYARPGHAMGVASIQ